MTVALVSGASRGIGKEIARQLEAAGVEVVRGARTPDPADPTQRRLDVTDQASIDELVGSLTSLDVLVNNAGISDDDDGRVTEVDLDAVRRTLETNLLGALRLSQVCVPLLRRSGHGRIVNISSGLGQLDEMGGGNAGYRLSKVGLNALARMLSVELAPDHVLVNTMCPGWVRTDMGGQRARSSVEEGADTATWLATLPDDGPTGGFFRHRKPIPW